MSLDQVKIILQRMVDDATFYKLFLSDIQTALQDYQLTPSEVDMLSQFSTGPYTRARQGIIMTKKLIEAAQIYDPTKSGRSSEK